MGGCYVETSTILAPGSKIKLGFSMDDSTLSAEGVVARLDPGSGMAVQFREMNREGARADVPRSGIRTEDYYVL